MPKVQGRHFAYTPEGLAAAERYKQAIGMAGGGMLGFRPLGYADGDLVEEYAYQDAAARQAAIDFIMGTIGFTSDSVAIALNEMEDPELRRAHLKVIEDAESGKYDSVPMQDTPPMQQMPPQQMPPQQMPQMQQNQMQQNQMQKNQMPRLSDRDIAILREQQMPMQQMPPQQMQQMPPQQNQILRDQQMFPPMKEPRFAPGAIGMEKGGIASLRRY